jgi:TP901 family phage tail tape measure protein
MADTTAVIDVRANTTQFRKAMTGVSASMYAAGGAASRFGTITRGVLTPLSASLTTVAISAKAVATIIQRSSVLFIGFNDTLARTGAILGESGAGMQALETEIRKVGSTTRFTAEQVGEAANALAIAGVNAEEMISEKALENLVKFAIAGGTDIQTATNIGIAGVKAFGMEMSELSFVSDVLTRTFTRSNVNIISLGEGMKFLAPVAHAAGVGIEEAAAAIGALGNAGLRGTIAGTGMRMAINKLLKPTFDSQKAINDLGLTIQVLSPAGEQARQTLTGVATQLDRTKMQSSALTNELKMLNGQMNDLSIEQKANTLAIEQIRARAARSNRDLTDMEMAQVERLTKTNDSLRVSEMELDLERMKKQRSLNIVVEQEKALDEQSKTLTKTVEQQTTGITSLGDVLDQLASAGATTTQVLEIFGVRGGTAVAALLSQRESFHELVKENENATDATKDYTKSLQQQVEAGGSAKESLLLLVSAIQEGMLEVGRPFVIMLTELAVLFKDDIQQALKDNVPLFKELALSIMSAMRIIVPLVIDMLPSMIQGLKAIVPIIVVLVGAFRILMAVLSPVLQLLSGIGQILMGIVNLFQLDFDTGLKNIAVGIKDAGIGLAITAASVATGGAIGAGAGIASAAGGMIAGRATTGAMMALGGFAGDQLNNPFSGGIQAQFADGGFVNGPTVGLVGEAGPEVVIPLGAGKEARRDALASSAGLGGMEVSIGDIVINGGSNLSIAEVRALMSNEMPRIIRQELLRGSRGVI